MCYKLYGRDYPCVKNPWIIDLFLRYIQLSKNDGHPIENWFYLISNYHPHRQSNILPFLKAVNTSFEKGLETCNSFPFYSIISVILFYYLKNVQILIFSGPCFVVLSPNTGKYKPEKIWFLDSFHAVFMFLRGVFKTLPNNQDGVSY